MSNNKLRDDIIKYSQSLIKHINNYEKALTTLKTKEAEWRVRLNRKGCKLNAFDRIRGFDIVKHPHVVRNRLFEIIDNADEIAKEIEKNNKK